MIFNHVVFNIIFIPGTVAYQSLGLISLLINSNLNFKLVGNGLGDKEAKLLKSISETSSRLDFINFKSQNILPHGTLLDLLFLSEKKRYFCFCDSDVFLFSRLSKNELLTKLNNNHVFSSGGRIENEDNAVYAGFRGGATTKSPDGNIDLATSFFCIYKRNPLKAIINQYKVGFEQYRIKTQIPPKAMAVVKELNLSFDMFDTGKLLSVLLHYEGFTQSFEEINNLIHIGGMSGRYLQNLNLKEKIILNDDLLIDKKRAHEHEYNIRNEYEKSLKKYYGRYYYCYLNYLINKGSLPVNNSTDNRINKTIKRLNQNLIETLEQAQQKSDTKKIISLIS